MKCCDFSMISRGMDGRDYLKAMILAMKQRIQMGWKPVYPHSEAPTTLCYTHGGGSFDTVVNPVCEIWRTLLPPRLEKFSYQKILLHAE